MKALIQLDKHDIAKIIAEHFGVDLSKVRVEPYIGTAGCGMDETEAAFIRAEVVGDFGAMCFNKHHEDNHFNEYHPVDNYGCYT